MTMRFGTHNLHDEAGRPTPFADIIVFTEAIPSEVKRVLEPLGYVVRVCRRQKDLVIAYRRGSFKMRGIPRYKKVVDGIAQVTPNRGTFWINGILDDKPTTIIAEHRINAAFEPFIRGEGLFRARMWRKHTQFTQSLIERLQGRGKNILAGGDLNTPRLVRGYGGLLREYGGGFDRLGVGGRRSGDVRLGGDAGSDHKKLSVEVY